MAAPARNPELGRTVEAAGIRTNLHDVGSGEPVLLIHGSGPGVSAFANWRLTMPVLSRHYRVIAPDMVGFGFTERPTGHRYEMDNWIAHLVGVLDALKVDSARVVGNSFGGALALALAIRHPRRVQRLVLMGSVGVPFPITPGLDAVWGYTPSFEKMRALMKLFSFDQGQNSDELAMMRFKASTRPGFHESYATMFPAPRQRWVDAMASDEEAIRGIEVETLVVHGREDQIIPVDNAFRLAALIPRAQLHVFGRCGHWTQIEHAAAFNQLTVDFFGEAGPAHATPALADQTEHPA